MILVDQNYKGFRVYEKGSKAKANIIKHTTHPPCRSFCDPEIQFLIPFPHGLAHESLTISRTI